MRMVAFISILTAGQFMRELHYSGLARLAEAHCFFMRGLKPAKRLVETTFRL